MSKNKQNGRAAKGGPSSLNGSKTPAPGAVPSKVEVLDWVRKDLQSAHYLLGIILTRHPEIVDEMADNVYETVMRKEQGAAIDHVSPDPAQTEKIRLEQEAAGYAD